MNYEVVVGLEVHVELATKTKIFCSCTTEFGGEPNTQVCEVCLGMPGTLPVLNRAVVDFAVRTGLALNCEVACCNKFDRKNYFYPDLPKAYQISQLYLPICHDGFIEIGKSETCKKIRIKEIHMEEDAGKLIHDADEINTLVDYNRCGVPLLEIVSQPDMRSAEEAVEYIEKLRVILQYIGVSDCKMQEGSLRADINLSVCPVGSSELGVRTEMKNMNSFKAIARAIKAESERQIALLEKGEKVIQETRRWDDSEGKSYAMRSKEEAQDYKYFPEPDISPVVISQEQIDATRAAIPELPDKKIERYTQLSLTDHDAEIIAGSVYLARLFECTYEVCGNAKEAANWILVDLLKLLHDSAKQPEDMDFNFDSLGKIILMVEKGKINRGTAKKVFEKVFEENINPAEYVEDNNLGLVTDTDTIYATVETVVKDNEKSVNEYKSGKTQALQYLIGQSMKALRGQAPAQTVTEILKDLLS